MTYIEWRKIDWRKVEMETSKLQQRIYEASKRGDKEEVRDLQRLLSRSLSAKLKAVRKVTQDNRGKNTPGVDGVKTLSPAQRVDLALNLKVDSEADNIRRTYIPKKMSSELRPLGIPTLRDRAKQALVLLCLEPEWEARFEGSSYGFRPGRSCHDAMEAIFQSIVTKPKYVLDADIRKCFDRINHEALLMKLETSQDFREQIRAWLKAGVLDGEKLFPSEEGTPQGGVISPFLANVALHGMEALLKEIASEQDDTPKKSKNYKKRALSLVRYADDFIVVHPKREVIEACRQGLQLWLSEMGLELHPEKTHIRHSLEEVDGIKAGFNFLGFQVLQRRVGKYRGKTQRMATFLQPSAESVRDHKEKLKALFKESANPKVLLAKLNPVIEGWSRYFSVGTSSKTFGKLDAWLYAQFMTWSKRQHPTRSARWLVRKYFLDSRGKWKFGVWIEEQIRLEQRFYSETKIKRHQKVPGPKSPCDGDWVYWCLRLTQSRKYYVLPKTVEYLLKKQKGFCAWCHIRFKPTDPVEVDHIVPRAKGGKNRYDNLQLLHTYCHHTKTAKKDKA